jgi:hypothetical protein
MHRQEKEREEAAMSSSITGKAFQFVEKILAIHKELCNTPVASAFDTVAKDDMVYMTERMLQVQETFRSMGRPHYIDMGYHYTREENMQKIREVRCCRITSSVLVSLANASL